MNYLWGLLGAGKQEPLRLAILHGMNDYQKAVQLLVTQAWQEGVDLCDIQRKLIRTFGKKLG